jgi:hypothetical protein
MGKAYTQVSNDARRELIKLIYEDGLSIVKAAEATGIYYPTAKAINKVYKREARVQKRSFRYRTKKEDEVTGVVRNKIPIEKLFVKDLLSTDDRKRITCGVRPISKVVRSPNAHVDKPTSSVLSSIGSILGQVISSPKQSEVDLNSPKAAKDLSPSDESKFGGAETTNSGVHSNEQSAVIPSQELSIKLGSAFTSTLG